MFWIVHLLGFVCIVLLDITTITWGHLKGESILNVKYTKIFTYNNFFQSKQTKNKQVFNFLLTAGF